MPGIARGSQSAVEEFGGGAVGADPIAPAEQVVNLAWRHVEPLNVTALHRRHLSSRLGFLKPRDRFRA